MTEEIVLDTTFDDPTWLPGEVEGLQFALERARAQFAWKIGGLDAAALNKRHPPSRMTMGGLIKHVARCEDRLTRDYLTGGPPSPPWDAIDGDTNPDWDWHSAADDSPEELYALWRDAVERSRAAWANALAEGGLDRPSTGTTSAGAGPNLRRGLIDTIEHTLRHTGHADLMREAIDGLVGEDPPR
jgi:Protein of unknown function (DUF664)